MPKLRFLTIPLLRGKRWIWTGLLLIAATVLLLSGCAAQPGPQSPATTRPGEPAQEGGGTQSNDAPDGDLATQRNDAGRVEIDVTPLTLSGDVWAFEVALNTHSVDLGFDLTEVAVLRCDQGQEFQAAAWDGSGPGGHHRSGVLQFAALDHPTSSVELVVRDVAKVPERIFRWDVPGEAASPEAGRAQSAEPQPSFPPAAGPPQVTLSAYEFRFGDVVMSKGGVSQAVEITNTGTGILTIEGLEPT